MQSKQIRKWRKSAGQAAFLRIMATS